MIVISPSPVMKTAGHGVWSVLHSATQTRPCDQFNSVVMEWCTAWWRRKESGAMTASIESINDCCINDCSCRSPWLSLTRVTRHACVQLSDQTAFENEP